jgi:hypothetical protein
MLQDTIECTSLELQELLTAYICSIKRQRILHVALTLVHDNIFL